MKEHKFEFSYKVYDSIDDLPVEQKQLLEKAKEATTTSYAPYSNFQVGAAARLANGAIVLGSNQENASYPVGICAERTLLGSVSALYPNVSIESIAISYQSSQLQSHHPISPCGLCRQTIQEYETRFQKPIQLILGGWEGRVFVIDSVASLLPLAFTSKELI